MSETILLLALREIGNIAHNMKSFPVGFDPKEQFERIRQIADDAVSAHNQSTRRP